MNGKMSREENRVLRRDKFAHKVKYSPKIGGLPLGRPSGYWLAKRSDRSDKGSEVRA